MRVLTQTRRRRRKTNRFGLPLAVPELDVRCHTLGRGRVSQFVIWNFDVRKFSVCVLGRLSARSVAALLVVEFIAINTAQIIAIAISVCVRIRRAHT